MTEDEAKQKWCPFARVAVHTGRTAGATHNRSINVLPEKPDGEVVLSPSYARCIGSGCMAWRWGMEEPGFTDADGVVHYRTSRSSRLGYCGLAGGADV